jgi:hypothetical protein
MFVVVVRVTHWEFLGKRGYVRLLVDFTALSFARKRQWDHGDAKDVSRVSVVLWSIHEIGGGMGWDGIG